MKTWVERKENVGSLHVRRRKFCYCMSSVMTFGTDKQLQKCSAEFIFAPPTQLTEKPRDLLNLNSNSAVSLLLDPFIVLDRFRLVWVLPTTVGCNCSLLWYDMTMARIVLSKWLTCNSTCLRFYYRENVARVTRKGPTKYRKPAYRMRKSFTN